MISIIDSSVISSSKLRVLSFTSRLYCSVRGTRTSLAVYSITSNRKFGSMHTSRGGKLEAKLDANCYSVLLVEGSRLQIIIGL